MLCNSQPLSFHHLNVEDGLSQNSVLCVTQDQRGLMWLGTRYGLNKYDSRKLTIYKNKPGDSASLSNNYILSLLCDHKGTLWVGTRKGLNRYNAGQDVFERVSVSNASPTQLPDIGINCLFEDSKGRLWVGSSHHLYVRDAASSSTFTSFAKYQNFPARGVLCIYEDRVGNIWAGTYGGVVQITTVVDGFTTTLFSHDPSDAESISDDQVMSIAQDHQDNLWMGTLNGGLNLYDARNNRFTHFTHNESPGSLANNHIRRLLYDGKNQLWIGTQEGISILDLTTRQFRSYANDPWDKNSLSQNSVHSLYKDNTGTIWIGTFFGGVNFHAPYSTDVLVYNNRSRDYRLNNNVISAMVEDVTGNLWIGTEGGGLNYLNRKTGEVMYYQHKPSDAGSIGSNLVKTVYKDRAGNIWAGTHGGGLNLFDPATQRFTRYVYKANDPATSGAEITSLLEDSRGIFWVGTEIGGIKLFERKGKTLLPCASGAAIIDTIGNKAILCLLETTNGQVWVGTSAGIYRINGREIQVLTEKSNYPYHVNSLTEDTQGNIWVGTYYNGVTVYNAAGKKIASYTQQDGLPDNNVLGILQDNYQKDLWMSTGNGLARLDVTTRRFTVYTEADGLAGNVFNIQSYYKSNSGELFFGGFDGVSAFYPQNMKMNTREPAMLITGLKLFNQPVTAGADDKILSQDISFTKSISLKHDQNVFTFDFAILSYVKPDKNKYAFQLQGFDKDWNYSSQGTASYTNIPPGQYSFIVKGANNDGTWSKPVAINVSVLPPFWKTWWAYSIYLLLFATLAFFIVRFFFLRALLKRNQELTQLKLNFFTNISHEIRTHLSLIIGPAEKLMLTAGHDEQEQQQLRTIKNNSDSLLQLVNELMDFRKAETGHLALHVSGWNIVPFVSAVFDSFHDISVSRNIQVDFISNAQEIEAWFDKEQLEKVCYNLLSNAFKFTPNGGYIGIAVEEKNQTVVIRVTDNGRGISEENLEKLFDNYFQEDDSGKQNTGYGIGLALSKSIVEMHKGSLSVSSEALLQGQQTCFTVTLLKGNAHFTQEQINIQQQGIKHNESVTVFPATLPEPAITTTITGNRNTILLVEDNPAIRTFIREALQQQYEILESSNGVEGLAAAITEIPDLIISDVMMPEMDGLTFCSHVKTDNRTSHIPVILLTAKTAVAHQISGLQTGADIYLTKPFSIQVLELQIRNLLSSRERLWTQFRRQLALAPSDDDVITPDTTVTDQETPEAPPADLHPLDATFLQQIIAMVEEHMQDPDFGIALLSKKAAMSQPVLFKKIKAITGMTANDFVKSLRLKKATELLQENRYTVYEIAYMVGYESSKYFSREFKKQFGKTPSEYTKQ